MFYLQGSPNFNVASWERRTYGIVLPDLLPLHRHAPLEQHASLAPVPHLLRAQSQLMPPRSREKVRNCYQNFDVHSASLHGGREDHLEEDLQKLARELGLGCWGMISFIWVWINKTKRNFEKFFLGGKVNFALRNFLGTGPLNFGTKEGRKEDYLLYTPWKAILVERRRCR